MTIQEEIPENETPDDDIEIHKCESRYTPINPKKNGHRERIYRFLEENQGVFTYHSVASKLGIKENSTRKVMLTMWKNGLIEREMKGWYYHKIHRSIHGMVGGLNVHPRVQNLWIVAGGVDGVGVGGRYPDAVWESMHCWVRLWLTSRRGRVSFHVHCPRGLDAVSLGMVWSWVEDEVADAGLVVGKHDWRVSSLEVFVDYERMRLDGVSGVTLTGFSSWLVKWYNKPCSRRELKSGAGFDESLDGVFRYLDGTVMQSADRVNIRELQEQMSRLEKTIKYAMKELSDAGPS